MTPIRIARKRPNVRWLLATVALVIVAPEPSYRAALGLLVPILPFSLLVVGPVNRRLEKAEDAEKAFKTLRRWGYLHGVRTIFAVMGFAALTI